MLKCANSSSYLILLLLMHGLANSCRAQNVSAAVLATDKVDSALQPRKGQHVAIAELRAIVEEVKKCPEDRVLTADGSGYVADSPLNVTWNINANHSSRSLSMAYVQLVRYFSYVPKPLEICRKRDSNCAMRNGEVSELNAVMETIESPDQFRYEFDVGPNGLEPTQAFSKHQGDNEEQWRASRFGSDCVGQSISVILADAGRFSASYENQDAQTNLNP